jgi:hypothetical protein
MTMSDENDEYRTAEFGGQGDEPPDFWTGHVLPEHLGSAFDEDRFTWNERGLDANGFRAWTKSRTFWTRLEPDTRDPSFETLHAPIHDPTWLLSRQWQFGEFEGEDAGSPVLANVHYEREHLGRVRLGTAEDDTARDYRGRPLEAMVEREPMTTASDVDPGLRTRVEAGQAFLRALTEVGYTDDDGEPYTAADFADRDASDGGPFVVSEPDEPMDGEARRYAALVAGRAVDGHAVYESTVTETTKVLAAADWRGVSWPSSGRDLPLPRGASLDDADADAFKDGLKRFVDHYAGLYDEPTDGDSFPWTPDRLEYGFAVSAGNADRETVLSADEYPGGHLDWYSFTVSDDDSLDAPAADDGGDDLVESGSAEPVLRRAEFKGMPVPRWWEFEDGDVSLDHLPAGPEGLSKALLVDFAFAYGNDWFVLPLDAPIGSLTHVPESVDGEPGFTVTDTFGRRTAIEPVTDDADHWNMYMHRELPSSDADRPGLFLPPTLDESVTSDPVERVYFARDEMANVAFAVEERVEGPTGDPRERAEFDSPSLVIDRIATGAGVADERIVFRNPGDAPLDVTGWVVEVDARASKTVSGTPSTETLHTFEASGDDGVVVDPDETLTLYTGTQPAGDLRESDEAWVGRSDRVWSDATPYGEVSVWKDTGTNAEDFVTRDLVTTPDEALPDYRLATNVPDHWFPLKPLAPRTGPNADPADERTYRLALALLLDADSMDAPLTEIPTPAGRLLSEADGFELAEEEIPRAGREVERYYQLARWTDGSTWVWSSRESSNGTGEAASQLRFDVLDDPDPDDASDKT